MNKRILSIVPFLLFAISTHSQSGIAYYKKESTIKTFKSTDNVDMIDNMQLAINQLEIYEYILSFNNEKATFKKLEVLNSKNNTLVEIIANGFANFDGKAYYNKLSNEVFHEKAFSNSTFLVKKDKLTWELSDETIDINGYKCHKATTIKTIESSKGKHDLEVIAWYSPEIPLPYGPDGFSGLPGLILKIEFNKSITVLKKIEFQNDELKIDHPSNKYITEQEFNEMALKAFKNRYIKRY